MTFKAITWAFFVTAVYFTTFVLTMGLLIANWRLLYGKDHNPPWVVVFFISFLGPIGLLAALASFVIDKVLRHDD